MEITEIITQFLMPLVLAACYAIGRGPQVYGALSRQVHPGHDASRWCDACALWPPATGQRRPL